VSDTGPGNMHRRSVRQSYVGAARKATSHGEGHRFHDIRMSPTPPSGSSSRCSESLEGRIATFCDCSTPVNCQGTSAAAIGTGCSIGQRLADPLQRPLSKPGLPFQVMHLTNASAAMEYLSCRYDHMQSILCKTRINKESSYFLASLSTKQHMFERDAYEDICIHQFS
jgi:hypothetical protein